YHSGRAAGMNLHSLRRFFGNVDYYLLVSVFLLCIIGIAAIYSAGVDADGVLVSREFLKQVIWLVIGLPLLVVAALFDFSRFKDTSWIFFAVTVVLLVITRIGGRVVNGARSWIGIGGLGIQPAEFAKIATVLMIAHYLDSAEYVSSFRKLVNTGLIAGIPVILILIQPDFGSSLVFFPAALVMLALAKVDFRYILFGVLGVIGIFIFLSIPLYAMNMSSPESLLNVIISRQDILFAVFLMIVVITVIAALGWQKFMKPYYFWISYIFAVIDFSFTGAYVSQKVLKPYQIARLLVFVNPAIDPRGSGWNILQSITAIGSGGFLGKGFLRGTHSHARFIPQQSTDFIFSIIAEEFGLLGCLVLFGLYLIIFMRCIVLIETSKDRYSQYVTGGILGIFAFHFMINIGMAMGIMPVTGIPLFFISYGGSALWAGLISVGILMGISARRYSA
ncbi:MAG: rod shape-determining protein RodA, partial [Rectinema sp.]|nr:rod shape-determining protein RodA [Rectinema sp.]